MRTIAFCLLLTGCLPAAVIEGEFEKRLEVSTPLDLEIESDSGSIEIRGGDSPEVVIHGRIRVWDRRLGRDEAEQITRAIEQDPPIRYDAGRLVVGESLLPERLRRASISYEIETPRAVRVVARSDSGSQRIERIAGPLEAEADSGSLTIIGVGDDVTSQTDSGSQHVEDVNGDLAAEADSGSIEVRSVSGSVAAETDSGSIRIDGSGAVRASTDSGSIHAAGLAGGFAGETDSGSIEIEQVEPGEIEADSDSGSVQVRLAEGGGYDLDLETDSGGVSVEREMSQVSLQRRNRLQGRIGEGGLRVRLSSDSGNVSVR